MGIQISLDGPDYETHGFLRKDISGNSRKELFDTALNSIKTFISAKIRVSVATCLHKTNINKIDEMKKLIISIKPSNWSISTISISGRAKENHDLYVSESRLSNEYWYKLRDECKEKNILVNFIDMPNILKDNESSRVYYECPAAKWFCEIYSDGTTTPCPLSRVNPPKNKIKWDNIKNMSIEQIWNNEPFEIFRSYSFKEMLNYLTPKEAVIICLRFGYIDNRYYSVQAISNFLGISELEVLDITKKILLLFKDNINKYLDNAIEYIEGNKKGGK